MQGAHGVALTFPEGPHLYRIGDYWYLLIAEGGTERGHAVSIARGQSPQGPFESYCGNPILTQLSTEVTGGMTGRMIEAICSSGEVLLRSGSRVGGRPPSSPNGIRKAPVRDRKRTSYRN